MKLRWILLITVLHFTITTSGIILLSSMNSPSVGSQDFERHIRICEIVGAVLTFPIGLLQYGGFPFIPWAVNSLFWGTFLVWIVSLVRKRRRTTSPGQRLDMQAAAKNSRVPFLLHILLAALFCVAIYSVAAGASLAVFTLLFAGALLNHVIANRCARTAGWSTFKRAAFFHVLGFVWLLAVVLLTIVPYPSGASNESSRQKHLSLAETIEAMRHLTKARSIPAHLMVWSAIRWRTDFNVNRYFIVLNRLSPEPGYALDYVYRYNRLGGSPTLYAKKKVAIPFLTYSAYRNAVEYGTTEGREEYLRHVQTDGTPEGFVQFVVLRIMANQFYLFWHANYNDERIVYEWRQLDDLLAKPGIHNKTTAEEKEKAKDLNLDPIVKMGKDVVKVKILTWTDWGGLRRKTFTITKVFPHRILNTQEDKIISYDCGGFF